MLTLPTRAANVLPSIPTDVHRGSLTTQTRAAEPSRRADGALPAASSVSASIRHGWALAVTLLIVGAGLFGPEPLRDVVTGQVPAGVRLETGPLYVLTAPLGNIWDTLTFMTVGQHYAVPITLILIFAAWRLFRRGRRRLGVVRRVAVELGVSALAFVGLLLFYAWGAVGPRPMAALAVDDPDVVVVDFHSHTEHSHDARSGFTAETRRRWHAAAGFDAVYVSDHRTWEGWRRGAERNPARAGEGTVLLPALEIRYANKYANALGDPSRYESAVDGNELIHEEMARLANETGLRPTFLLTLPERLTDLPPMTPDSIGYVALEMSDASPKGLRQSRQDRALLIRMTDSLALAPVSATNNHGWGRAAAAWTLMRVPGWQRMTPAQLNYAIERELHLNRSRATRVVERRIPWSGETPTALAMTVPALTWNMFGGLSVAERISWLAWTWGLALIVVPAARRRRRRPAP